MSKFLIAPPLRSLEEQIACVEREIAMRKSVYPRQVRERRMLHKDANEQVILMENVLHTLQQLLDDNCR